MTRTRCARIAGRLATLAVLFLAGAPGQAAADAAAGARDTLVYKDGDRVQGHLLDDCRDAARRAERAHGLASSPGAPVLEWIDHRQALAERRTAAIGGPLVGLGLYLLLMGIGAFSEWASRRAGRG